MLFGHYPACVKASSRGRHPISFYAFPRSGFSSFFAYIHHFIFVCPFIRSVIRLAVVSLFRRCGFFVFFFRAFLLWGFLLVLWWLFFSNFLITAASLFLTFSVRAFPSLTFSFCFVFAIQTNAVFFLWILFLLFLFRISGFQFLLLSTLYSLLHHFHLISRHDTLLFLCDPRTSTEPHDPRRSTADCEPRPRDLSLIPLRASSGPRSSSALLFALTPSFSSPRPRCR